MDEQDEFKDEADIAKLSFYLWKLSHPIDNPVYNEQIQAFYTGLVIGITDRLIEKYGFKYKNEKKS